MKEAIIRYVITKAIAYLSDPKNQKVAFDKLDELADKTETDIDDKIVAALREALIK